MKTIFTIIAICAFYFQIFGQDPYFEIIDKNKGLPSNSVYCVYQDSKGFIWFAHENGLSKYDGFEFKTFTNEEQTSKSGSNIFEDQFGRIWYQNFDGYLYYVEDNRLKSFKQEKPAGFLESGIVGNKLIVCQQKGIDFYDIKSLKKIKSLSIDMSVIVATKKAKIGFLLSKMNSILVLKENFEIKKIKFDNQINLSVMCGDENGYFGYNKNQKLDYFHVFMDRKHSKLISGNFNGFIQNISYTPNKYWFCSTSGAYSFTKKGEKIVQDLPIFTNYNISSVLQDNEGGFWFSTTNEGVIYVPNFQNKHIFKEEKITQITELNNEILLGTKKDEVISLNSKKLIYHGKNQHEILNLYADQIKNKLFISSSTYVIQDLRNKSETKFDLAVKDLIKIDENNYAFAASGVCGILNYKKNKCFQKFPIQWSRSLDQDYNLQYILENVRGKSVCIQAKNLYFATNVGLFEVGENFKKEIKFKGKSIFSKKLLTFKNEIFALQSNGNLLLIDGQNQIKELNESFKIEKNQIEKIILAKNSLFIFVGNNIYQKNLLYKNSKLNLITNFSNEVNSLFIKDNQLYFATDKGLIIQQNSLQTKLNKSVFYINSFSSNKHILSKSEYALLEPKQNTISIDYSILNFKQHATVPLYYRINKQNWVLTSPLSRNLYFPLLASGKYEIEFCFENFKILNDKTIIFEIKKPWYLNNWVILIFLCFFITLFFVFYKLRINILNRKNKLLEEKYNLEKQVSTSMLKAIKSQMNPHFFYNALNTIQSFIYSNDKQNASNYLAKFSKLTRTILEMSELEKISLTEEINALNLYLDLEKVRLNDDFSFEIKCDKSLNQDFIKIPSMLIQPYVENAIKHGLLHKKGYKVLKLNFIQEQHFLFVEIDDNGVGRKKSEELNSIKREKHKSFATEANEKRIELINKSKESDSNAKFNVKFIDKMDNHNISQGTTVILKILI